ncbi:branched-chain amino acid ABC transporter substrate-binding protein [Castellaniella sp.]|uniref:branched-chain amino acid ABC transporter substrate-binding protein n=1 Tax=Castellaniella sp. TaxID=1955812 RepID=UPI00355DDEE5
MKKIFAYSASATVVGLALGMSGAALAAEGGPLLFGLQFPITGDYAVEGQGVKNGLDLLIEQKNAEGGLLGREIKLIVCDDEGKASRATICARQLVNDGVIGVVGSYTSGASLAAGPTYSRANVIHSSDGTSDELTAKGWKNFFRNDPPNSAEAAFTGDYLVNTKGYKNIAIITDHSSYATDLADSVEKSIKTHNGHIASKEFINAGTQDYTAVLTKIKSVNPDVVYFSGYYTDGGLIKAQMDQLKMAADFVGGDTNQSEAFIQIAGASAPGSVVINVPPPESLPYENAARFLADYKEKYGSKPPSIYTLTNVDGLNSIFAAIEATQSTDFSAIEQWLHNMPAEFEGLTGKMKWDENGERAGSLMAAMEVQPDGSFKIVHQ